MPKFTQGTWYFDNDNDLVYTAKDVIAKVMNAGGNQYSTEEGRANGNLIAAAPEMYKWIEDTRSFLFDLKRYCQDEDEMNSFAEQLSNTYRELITTSDLLLARIEDNDEA